MNKMRKGATFIEYALLAGLIAIIVAGAAYMFGGKIKALFTSEGNKTDEAKKTVESVKFTNATYKVSHDYSTMVAFVK